jgi:hypothetical protein
MEQLMLPGVLYVTEAHDYLQREFWLHIHGGLLEALRSGNLEQSEARSIANARKIRELMFQHNGQRPGELAAQLSVVAHPLGQHVSGDGSTVEPAAESPALRDCDPSHP